MERAGSHAREVERAFTVQAEAFEDSSRNQPFTLEARWVFDRLPRSSEDLALDVAAGTGHAARQLAPSVRAVVALDATPAMVARGHAAALSEGLGNVVFMRHDASELPFLDGSFAIVVCRFAFHHFERPRDVLAEMPRCTRAGGHLVVVDLLADSNPVIASEQDRLERVRDPSHTHLIAPDELRSMLNEQGLELVDLTTRPVERPLQPWLDQAAVGPAAAQQIKAALEAELAGGEPTGLRPRVIENELWFAQTFGSFVTKRAG